MSKQKCEEIFQRSLAKVAKESIGFHQAAQTYMDGFKERVQEITEALNNAMLRVMFSKPRSKLTLGKICG